MNKIDLTPGCYTLPLGSDPIRWLAKHCAESQTLNPMVILPTQRSVNRFQRLLYVLNSTLALGAKVIAYEELSEGAMPLLDSKLLLWELSNQRVVTAGLFQNKPPSLAQRKQLASALNSMLSEIYAHEIDVPRLKAALALGVPTRDLIEIVLTYEHMLKRNNLTHSMVALTQGIKSFSDTVESLNRPIYLIVDGAIPPALQRFAATLSKDHYVLIYGDVPTLECSGYDSKSCYSSLYKVLQHNGVTIHPLALYTHRKRLIEELQKPIFESNTIGATFKNIQCIEHSNDIHLARYIIMLAKEAFAKKIKSIAVVTPNQNLARVIHMQAKLSGIPVDDSSGIQLKDTMFGSLLIQMLRCLAQRSNYHGVLNMISHPAMIKHWGELPSKLDVWGRANELSFFQTLLRFSPADDYENERLLELIQFMNASMHQTFSTQLDQALAYLNQWEIRCEDYPESQEILDIAESTDTVDAFEFILSSTSFRTPTPKEPHIQIMGPLEARLMHPKVVVIASLNEGDWPMPPSSNPWLHAHVRTTLGLPDNDQITGISSKVLLALMACESVHICRTTHQNGQPIQPSRWWERLNVISTLNNVKLQHKGSVGNSSISSNNLSSFKIPEELIPRRLSISDIQLLINDPRQFILRVVLKLDELPMWEAETDVRHKGIIVHSALEIGVKKNLSVKAIIDIALNKLSMLKLDSHERMFWETQIDTNINNFDSLAQSTHSSHTHAELKAEWNLTTQFGAITIVGKADRIDQFPDGSLQIVDYKTGSVPSKNSVYKGLSPQLPLLGMMMKYGTFKEIPSTTPFMLSYWNLKEGTTLNFLYDEIAHLENELISTIEKVLDPASVFDITDSNK